MSSNVAFGKTWCGPLLLALLSFLFQTHSYSQSTHTVFIPVEPSKLPNTSVRCFLKDSKGFMWFGTSAGIKRYDGTNIYSYEHNPEDSTSICHNNINTIVEYDDGNIWIGTSQGLCR